MDGRTLEVKKAEEPPARPSTKPEIISVDPGGQLRVPERRRRSGPLAFRAWQRRRSPLAVMIVKKAVQEAKLL